MKKKMWYVIIGLSILIMLSANDASARSSSTDQNASVRSSSSGSQSGARAAVRGGSSSVGYRGGLAKAAATGTTSSGSGYRGGGNHYYTGSYHRHYHGYYGWGSYWPYWSTGDYLAYIPDYYTTVYVDGTPYYYCDGSYFMPYSNGYMVVPPPTSAPSEDQEAPAQAPPEEKPVAAQPKSASNDTTTIGVPNSKGGFTQVRLVKHKNGYIGPQGEFYTGHPTVAALKALYGD
jgi:hypothetical protein